VPLVIGDRLNVHPAFAGEFSRGESFHIYSVSLYHSTEFKPVFWCPFRQDGWAGNDADDVTAALLNRRRDCVFY
jgi:hypothetical protein